MEKLDLIVKKNILKKNYLNGRLSKEAYDTAVAKINKELIKSEQKEINYQSNLNIFREKMKVKY